MNTITNATDVFKFNLKSLLKKTNLWIYMGFFFVLAFLLIVVLLPYRYAGGPVLMTYMVLPLFIIIGWTGYNLRKSTLYSNVSTSGIDKKSFYLGQVMTVVLFGNILSLMFFGIVFMLSPFAIWSANWGITQPDPIAVNPFANGAWINIIYITELTSVLTFSVYFLIHPFMKSEKTYYVVIVSFYILGIIFSGSLNNYFGTPWWYMTITGDYTVVDGAIQMTQEQFASAVFATSFDPHTMQVAFNLFPESIFGPTLLFPFFGVGQFTTTAVFAHATADVSYAADVMINVVDASGNVIESHNLYDMTSYGISWNYFTFSFTEETWQWTAILLQPYIWILTSYALGTVISKYTNK